MTRFFGWVLALGLLAASAGAQAVPARPNIVLIVADDLGWGDVGWHGSDIPTPNLDAMAYGGARLEQHYVAPVCSPTRAQLMTGRYACRTGLQGGAIVDWDAYG